MEIKSLNTNIKYNILSMHMKAFLTIQILNLYYQSIHVYATVTKNHSRLNNYQKRLRHRHLNPLHHIYFKKSKMFQIYLVIVEKNEPININI